MLLQHLLLRGKRNGTRRRSELGEYRTVRNSGWWRGCFPATAIRQNAGLHRRYSGRGSDYLGLAHLVGIDANRRALDRLSRGERIPRHRHYRAAIYIVDVGDVNFSDIDVRDPGVGDVHLADVRRRHTIGGVVGFARSEREPANQIAAHANGNTTAESSTTDEGDQRRSVVGTRRNHAGVPSPTVVGIRPTPIVKWSEAPGFIVNPGPA